MDCTEISERLAIQILIGLLGDDDESDELVRLTARARQLGLTGAEIGVARRGKSFDVRDAQAMALSRAYRAGVPDAVNLEEMKAIDAGLSQKDLGSIKHLVDTYVSSHRR